MIYDAIIIGLGPAGISAAIYAKRSGLNVLALESEIPGGLINYTYEVDNYPGFNKVSGSDLANAMYEHLKTFDVTIKYERVTDIILGENKKIISDKGEYFAKTVIIATGRKRRKLGLPLEEELSGHGVSYCALCDGNFFKDKTVAVVGSGDSAFEEALYLAKIANHVTILMRSNSSKANVDLIKKVEKNEKIKIEKSVEVVELIKRDDKLESVNLSNGTNLKIDGLFIYVGFEPNKIFEQLDLKTDDGYIVVDESFETNIDGIYAVGDAIKKDLYQIISAEYEGASAAIAIARKLTKKN